MALPGVTHAWRVTRNSNARRGNKHMPRCKDGDVQIVLVSVCVCGLCICGERLPKESHENDRIWKAKDAERKCNKPTCKKTQSKKGIWRCIVND